MINQVQLQDDLFALLSSDPRLDKVNIVNERLFRLIPNALESAIWMTPRGGCQGQGILVEIPKLDVQDPNVSGPVFRPILSFVCVQAGDMAFAPGVGANMYAEEIAQHVTDLLHQQADEGIGTFMCDGTAVERATDPEYQSVNAMRVTLRCSPSQSKQTPRVPVPQIAVFAGAATLTCPDPLALLYYTTDGWCPAPDGSPTAQQYTSPFTVASGQVIRFAAWRDGYNNSMIRKYVVP